MKSRGGEAEEEVLIFWEAPKNINTSSAVWSLLLEVGPGEFNPKA